MWVLWAGLAVAQEAAPQQMLHDGLVLEGLYGDLEAAAQRYRLVVRNAAMDDATRARALGMLGRALYDLGRLDEARNALFEGRASGVCDDNCVELLQALIIEQEAVTGIPSVWTFEVSDHGFFHPLTLQDQGAIRLGRHIDGTGVLEWETTPPARGRDRLVIGLQRPVPAPREVELAVTSAWADAGMVLVAEDELGRRYALPEPHALPRGQTVRWSVPLRRLAPAYDGIRLPLDTSRITRLALEAVGPTGVKNLLLIHDFAVR